MMADVLIFDMASIDATATYPEPHQYAKGFDIVIVNGQIARQFGVRANALYGRVLAPE